MFDNEKYTDDSTQANISGADNHQNHETQNTQSAQQSYIYQGTNNNDSYNNGYNSYDNKPRKTKEPKKSGGFLGKLVTCIALGLFFGLFAGVGFVGVQQLSNGLFQESEKTAVSGSVQNNEANNPKGNAQDMTAMGESESGIKLTNTSQISVVTSDVTEMVAEVMPAMVSIVNNYEQSGVTIFGQSYTQQAASSGTGIIVAESDTELLIVSNHHVVSGAKQLDVTFIDGSVVQAQIKGMDADMDLAVIAIPLESLTKETKSAIAISTIGDSDNLKLGEPVIAIGNALGYGQSVTDGIVSALNREISMEDGSTGQFIQTNAEINPGNSGGALLNINGEVIGINSSKIGGSSIEGMGYAIPISAAKPIIDELMLRETRTKVEADKIGYMGISMQTIDEQYSSRFNMPQGVFILDVEDGSPADKAGLLYGDIIVKFDGEKISSHEDLQEVLQYYAAGATATVTVKRPVNGQYVQTDITITLGVRPQSLR